MGKNHLFLGLKFIVNCFNSSHDLSLAIIFITSCFPYSDPHSDSNPAPPIRERSNCVQIYSDLITCTGLKSLVIC